MRRLLSFSDHSYCQVMLDHYQGYFHCQVMADQHVYELLSLSGYGRSIRLRVTFTVRLWQINTSTSYFHCQVMADQYVYGLLSLSGYGRSIRLRVTFMARLWQIHKQVIFNPVTVLHGNGLASRAGAGIIPVILLCWDRPSVQSWSWDYAVILFCLGQD